MLSSFFAALALLSAVQVVAAAKDGSISWTVYHSWNQNQDYVRRGSLVWGPPSSDGETKDAAAAAAALSNDDKQKYEFQIMNDDASASLTAKDINDMLEYGWYHVKIQGNEDDSSNFVFQTVPACNLRRANFKDQFEITLPRSSLGDKQDPLTSFAYTPLVSPLAPKTCGEYVNNNDDGSDSDSDATTTTRSFSSRVSVQLDTPAMTLKTILPQTKPPPGISFAKQPKQQGATGGGTKDSNGDASSSSSSSGDDENYDDEGETEAPSAIPSPGSFLMKYWYVILPMLIMNLLTTQKEEQPPQEGEQQQGDKNSGGGNTIAPPAAASSQQKARRGKTSKKN
jgi:hypothetical protein